MDGDSGPLQTSFFSSQDHGSNNVSSASYNIQPADIVGEVQLCNIWKLCTMHATFLL